MRNALKARTIILSLTLAIIFILSSAVAVSACEISLSSLGTSGEEVTIEVHIYLDHRKCDVPIADTIVELENLTLVEQTPWQLVATRTYTAEITLLKPAQGDGTLAIIRECVKGGGSAAATVSPDGKVTIISQPAASSSGGSSSSGTSSSSSAELSWGEAFGNAISQPYIIAYFALTIFAYIAFRKGARKWRFVSLAFSMIYLGFFLGLCPCVLGALQNVLLHGAEAKTYMVHFVLLGIPVASTLFWGRFYCGWVCPMGAVQQILYRKDTSVKVSPGLHNILKYLPYGVLLGLVIAVFVTGTAAFAEVDPFKSLFNMEVSPIPTTLLVITIIASLFIFAPWCRYACPMGAFLSIVARFSRLKLMFKSSCKNCAACARAYCSYQAIDTGETLPVINEGDCARCGECVSRCPKQSLELGKSPTKEKAGTAVPIPGKPEMEPTT